MASRDDPVDGKCISLALDWLSKLHESRVVNNAIGEHVTASQVTTDEFRKRLEQPNMRRPKVRQDE
jgi:hypothetical protein